MVIIISSDHNFAHVTTAVLSWHVQNYDLIWSLFFMQEQYVLLQDLGFELMNYLWHVSEGLVYITAGEGQFYTAHSGKSAIKT